MSLKDGDTIAAIATAAGKAGIGVVRVSGPAVFNIASQITHTTLEPRKAHHCRFIDAQGHVIDEGIAILYKAPASFSGEDILELQTHGSPIVLDLILERVLQLGARPAQPGEFSLRAFLNDKYDLVQLEAIADLVASSSKLAARGAQRALQGEMSAKFMEIAERIKRLRIHIEAELDFADEDIDVSSRRQLEQNLQGLIREIRQIKKDAQHSICLYEGADVAIVGQTNVGKSSLLNKLTQRDAAIVNPQPGTTRDIVRHDLIIEGIPIRLLDTAGLRETEDPIEQEGIQRTEQAVQSSDLLLLLVDTRHAINGITPAMLEQFSGRTMLVVLNKIDLLDAPIDDPAIDVQISAKTGEGLETLKQRIKTCLTRSNTLDPEHSIVFANRRHLDAMNTVDGMLSEIISPDSSKQGLKLELIAENLHLAHRALENITGAYSNEALLSDIFSRFCIGK